MLDEDVSLLKYWNDDILRENRAWMVPYFYNEARGVFLTVIQTWIVRTPDRMIVIDTSGGNDKDRPLSARFHMKHTDFPDRLAAVGIVPDKVDTVILTHLHVDHVGWNTRLEGGKWVPMFPNAEHIVSEIELEARDPERGAASRPPGVWNVYNDSVKPVLEAGLVRRVAGNENIAPGIDLMPTPGHAPGQMAVRLRSGGKEALFIADVMHNPIQVSHPDWNSKYCENQDLAAETRARVLRHATENESLILPGHFNKPYSGYVRQGSGGYVFEPSRELP